MVCNVTNNPNGCGECIFKLTDESIITVMSPRTFLGTCGSLFFEYKELPIDLEDITFICNQELVTPDYVEVRKLSEKEIQIIQYRNIHNIKTLLFSYNRLLISKSNNFNKNEVRSFKNIVNNINEIQSWNDLNEFLLTGFRMLSNC